MQSRLRWNIATPDYSAFRSLCRRPTPRIPQSENLATAVGGGDRATLRQVTVETGEYLVQTGKGRQEEAAAGQPLVIVVPAGSRDCRAADPP